MSEQQQPEQETSPEEKITWGDGTGIAIGLSVGVLVGLTLLDNLGLGAALGLCFGAAYDGLAGRRKR
jgi:hypothetical protein